jgi:hypothetical protein
MCGKPLAFRRRPPPFSPSAGRLSLPAEPKGLVTVEALGKAKPFRTSGGRAALGCYLSGTLTRPWRGGARLESESRSIGWSAGSPPRPVGVSPALAGASRSHTKEVLRAWEKRQVETEAEVHEGGGGMPALQRARRPRYSRRDARATAGEMRAPQSKLDAKCMNARAGCPSRRRGRREARATLVQGLVGPRCRAWLRCTR